MLSRRFLFTSFTSRYAMLSALLLPAALLGACGGRVVASSDGSGATATASDVDSGGGEPGPGGADGGNSFDRDASQGDETGIHPPPCPEISASDYDQSCTTDSDCVAVYSGSACSQCFCPNATINAKERSRYDTNVSMLDLSPSMCGCPFLGTPRCGDAGTCVSP